MNITDPIPAPPTNDATGQTTKPIFYKTEQKIFHDYQKDLNYFYRDSVNIYNNLIDTFKFL